MCKRGLTEFLAELTELAVELSEFSLLKQYSRNSIPPVPYLKDPQKVDLVSQCSATRDTVAATPPVARHDFMIYAWPT